MADGSPLTDVNGTAADCTALMTVMLKNLHVVKFCQNNALASGCTGKYKGNDTILKDNNSSLSDYDTTAATSGCGNFREASVQKSLSAYVLANGMIILPYSAGSAKLFLVDVNGKRGPNKWGYDLHVFALKSDYESPQYYPSSCGAYEKGGKSTADMVSGR